MTPEQEHDFRLQVQRGPGTFVHLYDHYFPRIHAYVCYRVPGQQDAEDLISEVFLKAIDRLGRFRWRGAGSFGAWLFRIAHNLVADYFRAKSRATETFSPGDDTPWLRSPAPLPDEVLAQLETFRQMKALVSMLSPRRQEVITLRFYGGLRNKEIASVLGLDQRTVASHLSRGLRDLERRYAALHAAEQYEAGNLSEVAA